MRRAAAASAALSAERALTGVPNSITPPLELDADAEAEAEAAAAADAEAEAEVEVELELELELEVELEVEVEADVVEAEEGLEVVRFGLNLPNFNLAEGAEEPALDTDRAAAEADVEAAEAVREGEEV